MTKQKNLNDVLTKLIATADDIIDYKVLQAKGEEIPDEMVGYGTGEEAQNYIIDLIKPLINKHEEVKEIEAKNSSDVIQMINKGLCTVKEGMELIKLMKAVAETKEKEIIADMTENLLK